jgi:prepilin-type N-terminal cleavage/methylation domain-containing protein
MRGFSLVELSIVLVILGLLTGGILTGQNLIRAAELRSVTTDYQRFITAIQTFRDKYTALPGDMRNATAFWGDQATGTGACADAAVTDGTPGTCNGNGNGLVGGSTSNERYRFWQHLQLAGLIEGTYSGIAGSGGAEHHIPGVNAPASKLSSVGWASDSASIAYAGDSALWSWSLAEAPGHELKVGRTTSSDEPYGRAFTPVEMWNIDKKVDDGLPGRGKMWTRFWDECTDATAHTQKATANYLLSESEQQCSIYFVQAF